MTERTAIRQSMVDDDAISLTSTAVSEYDSDAEFSVDRILAERTESGKKRYLIFWEGYPLEKATWEPHKNINDEILEAWKERKSQESKGLEAPFNVAEFDALLARLATEKADRRRRRKAKRRRLGRTVSPSASEADDSDSSIEAIEENEVEDVKPGSKRKSKSPPKKPAKAPKSSTGRRESTSSLASIDAPRKAPVKKASGMSKQSSDRSHPPSRQASEASRHSRTLSHSSSDTPLSKRRSLRRNSIVRPSSSSSEGPLAPPKPTAAAPKPPATAPKSSATESNHPASTSKPPAPAPKPTTTAPTASNVWKLTAARKTTSNSEPSTLSDELPPTRGAYSSRGRVATRGGGNVAHKNVFQPREPPKKRGTLLKNAMDPAKAPKKFSNMRLHRKAELQSRDLAEGAPDINALGGLFDPSRPDSMVPIRPENLRKTSSNMVSSEKEPNPLFVNSRESSPGASDLRRMANNQPQPPEQVSSALRGLSICYYWDKQQKGTDQPPCKMGTACRFLHRYAPGVPIAPPPISVGPDIRGTAPAGPSQSTCFFWDRGIKFGKEFGCGKGDLCPYQHRYEEGMPIAAPPTGFVDNDTSRSKTLDDPQRAFIYSQAPLTEHPSTDDFAPWPADSSESRPQDPAPLPPWRTGSGDTSQADSAQQDVFTPVPDLTTVLQTLRTTNDSPMDPAHERRPEAPLKETTIPNGEAPSRPAWDPYMPTHAICHFYFNNGSCSKEFRCKYIHSLAPSLPIAPSIREQAKIFARTPCLDFQKGFCRYTATSDCRFLHHTESPKKKDEVRKEQSAASPQARSSRLVSEQGASSTDTSLSEVRVITNPTSGSSRGPAAEFHHIMPPRAPKSQTRPEWDPFDPFNSICYFWYTNGDCIKGRNCNFAHNEDPDLPIAPAPQDQAAIKKTTTGTCPEERDCQYIHSNDPNLAVAPSPLEISGRPAWDSRNPLHAICYFLASTGSCTSGSRCKFFHSNDPTLPIAPSPTRNEIIGPTEYDERGRPTCRYWLRDDCNYVDSTCRFWHAREQPSSPTKPTTTGSRAKSVSFAFGEDMPLVDEPESLLPSRRPVDRSPGLPAPSSGLPVIGTKTMPKTKIDEYRRYTTQRELASGAKEVTFGLDETQSFILDFGDLNQTLGLPWGFSFSGITRIRFDQMCIAQDFQAQQGLLQRLRLWHGNMLSIDAKDSQTVEAVDKAADELIRRSAGLFASFPDFLVLAFPAKRLEWKFLESTLDYPQDARLRYLIFQSNVDIRQSFKIKPTSLEICAYRDVLVEKIHGLDINRLLPVFRKSKPKPPNVYLLFPSTAAQTADFIISWLRSSNRSCKVYTSQSEGSWQYFTHTPEIDQGIVLVHESAAAQLYRLPNLYSVAAEKNFAFWYISESSSPYPLFPSTSYYFDDSTMGQLNAVRLFPHGCAFLLTPSFLVAEPHNALQVLNWFICGGGKPKYLLSTPRTWKLVCCHKLADYILEIANSKAAEKDALELKHRDNPAKDAILHDTGLSFNECNIRYKLHRLLVDFESKRSLESFSEFESDSDESDYPFIHANKHINPDNEKALVEWFAEWTMRNLDMYKKFVVVGSS
ncbi:hypothetical protein N431DRAFT_391230, partial [Stipitochalara longipes BDJ]